MTSVAVKRRHPAVRRSHVRAERDEPRGESPDRSSPPRPRGSRCRGPRVDPPSCTAPRCPRLATTKTKSYPADPRAPLKNNGVASSSGRRCSTSAPHSNSVRATATEPLSAAACNASCSSPSREPTRRGSRRRHTSLVEQTIHRVFIARATRPRRARGVTSACHSFTRCISARRGTRGVAKRRHCREIVVGGFEVSESG